jgi:hypothetical protein
MNILKLISLPIVGATLIFILFTALVSEVDAQETQYTYCEGPNGDVVIVTNFTCPPGYWRT